ncbi:MAG: hypothetical protein ABIH50_04965 [bacterium]
MINYFLLTLFLLVFFAFGQKILGCLAIKDLPPEEKPLYSIGLGLGMISLLILLLGCLGLLYSWIIWTLLAIIIIFSTKELIPVCHNLAGSVMFLCHHFQRRSVLLILLLQLLLGFIFINLISALAPITDYDSLSYHLLAPKKYIAHHRLYPMPDSFQSYWTLAIEITYIPFLLLGRPELASLLSFFLSILTIYLIIVFINKYISQDPLVSVFAALIFYSQPVVAWLITPKIDLGFTFFSLLILFSLFNWYYQNNKKWLWLASIFLGLTTCIKLTGIYYFPIFFIYIFFVSLYKNNKATYTSSFTYALLTAGAFSLFALLFPLPWLAKTFVWTGDPFYPFLTSFNGHKYVFIGGHDKTLIQYLRLPFDLTFHFNKFSDWGEQSPSPYFLFLLPTLITLKRKSAKNIILLLILSVVIITLLFFSTITLRYLLPAFALLSICLALAFFNFLEKIDFKLKYLFIVILIFSLSRNLLINQQRNLFLNKLLSIISPNKKAAYLNKADPWSAYNPAVFANSHLHPNAKIFSPHNSAGFYFNQEFISGQLEFSRYYEDFEQVKSFPDALLKLKKMGFTHLLINTTFYYGWWRKNWLAKFNNHKLGNHNLFANPFYQPEIKDWLDRNYECIYNEPYLFTSSQFNSQNAINRLLNAINYDNYGIEKINNLEQLNNLLAKPNWYSIWRQKQQALSVVGRYPKSASLAYQKREINKLNRLTIELTYPNLCPWNGSLQADHYFIYKL